ncbi:hypothetical protein C4588_06850 [Candidatus Parcubacteria bacterium]|nr:MAG: hypothetical protein C4588_06850 [Candidatus Parcubacteria bacterium]
MQHRYEQSLDLIDLLAWTNTLKRVHSPIFPEEECGRCGWKSKFLSFFNQNIEHQLTRYWRGYGPSGSSHRPSIEKITSIVDILLKYHQEDDESEAKGAVILATDAVGKLRLLWGEDWFRVPDAPDAQTNGFTLIDLENPDQFWGSSWNLENRVKEFGQLGYTDIFDTLIRRIRKYDPYSKTFRQDVSKRNPDEPLRRHFRDAQASQDVRALNRAKLANWRITGELEPDYINEHDSRRDLFPFYGIPTKAHKGAEARIWNLDSEHEKLIIEAERRSPERSGEFFWRMLGVRQFFVPEHNTIYESTLFDLEFKDSARPPWKDEFIKKVIYDEITASLSR